MPGSQKKAAERRMKQNAGKAPSIKATTVLTRYKQTFTTSSTAPTSISTSTKEVIWRVKPNTASFLSLPREIRQKIFFHSYHDQVIPAPKLNCRGRAHSYLPTQQSPFEAGFWIAEMRRKMQEFPALIIEDLEHVIAKIKKEVEGTEKWCDSREKGEGGELIVLNFGKGKRC